MGLRFGLIGYGAWGRFHADAIARTPSGELVAVATASADSVAAARHDHPHAAVTSDYRELLARGDVDVVSVVAPNALHEAIAVAALDAGKHLVLEKPMATTVAGCDRILAAAARAGRTVNVVHELRASSQWGRIKEWVDDGTFGEPLSFLFTLWRRPFRSGAADWRYDAASVGSWLLEEPVHFVDLAAWYFERLGPPASVYAAGNGKGRAGAMYDNLAMTLRWPEGQYAVLTQSVAGFEDHKVMEIVGTAGAARALWSGAMDRTDRPTASLRLLDGLTGEERFDIGQPRDIDLHEASGEIFELLTFYQHVAEGVETGRSYVSAEAGRRAVAICVAAEQSVRERREIDLAELLEGRG
ncbi:MAG: Gfo/Idh/MocA family oxidoreductase [Ectothiorhodospiraceae bacterium]|nr:Gfo/Idh/MocA family oxidoreductase [Ectothiorhodospiraceae bacterium]